MSTSTPITIDDERVRNASRDMELAPESLSLIPREADAQGAAKALLAGERAADAVALVARVLAKPYAVAWICQCARQESLADDEKAAVSVAERWLREPTEPNRRRAADFAASAGYKTPGAMITAAAGWSGGSLGPPGQPDVPPPDKLTARAAATALVMLASRTPEQFADRLAAYLEKAWPMLGPAKTASGGA